MEFSLETRKFFHIIDELETENRPNIYIYHISSYLLSVAVHNINTSFDSVNRAKIRIARLSFLLICIDLNDLQEALPENYIYTTNRNIYISRSINRTASSICNLLLYI